MQYCLDTVADHDDSWGYDYEALPALHSSLGFIYFGQNYFSLTKCIIVF